MQLTKMADYMPMISNTAAYRYVCRHADCGFIPMAETGWFICKRKDNDRQ